MWLCDLTEVTVSSWLSLGFKGDMWWLCYVYTIQLALSVSCLVLTVTLSCIYPVFPNILRTDIFKLSYRWLLLAIITAKSLLYGFLDVKREEFVKQQQEGQRMRIQLLSVSTTYINWTDNTHCYELWSRKEHGRSLFLSEFGYQFRKGYPLQYSDLENFMDCIVHGITKSRTRLNVFH